MERSASMLKGGEKCRTSRFLNISILAALTLLPIPDFFGESPDMLSNIILKGAV